MQYFTTIRATTIAVCTALLITSCGGGGGSTPAASTAVGITAAGIVKVVDGYITGAIVFLDKNKNGVRDNGEPTAINSNPAIGEYTFKGIAQATLNLYPVVVDVPVGATDSDRPGQPITKAFNMTSTTGSNVISPMTTLIQSQLNNNPGTTPAQAQASIKKLIGLPANSTVDLTANYLAPKAKTGVNKAAYKRIHKVAQSVAASVAANQTTLENAEPKGTIKSTLVDLMVQNALASLPTIVMKVDVAGANFNPASTGTLIGAAIPVINVKKLQQQLASQKKKLAKPVLTLTGPSVITLTAKAGATYVDQGAVLHSNVLASIVGITVTSKVSGTGTVIDPTIKGSYTIKYTATDKKNIAAAALTRTVNVIAGADKTPPVLQLIGGNQTFAAGTAAYIEQGAVALDAVVAGPNALKTDISSSVVITGLVNSGKKGTYTISYNVKDSAGNAAKKLIRTVTVTAHVDKTPATIVLKGAAVMTVVQNSPFKDPGADAVDLIDGTKPATVTGTVNSATVGKVTLKYSSTDANGNVSISVTRVINVVKAKDTVAPVITLKGGNVPAHKQGTPYIDAGATAFDAVDGNLTGTMIVKNPVDVTTPGVYTIAYNVKDAAGNPAIKKTRIVTVKAAAADTTPPVLTLKGKASITIVQRTAYKDAGATAFDLKDGDITANIVGTNLVNTARVATYTVTYNVKDAAGNPAIKLVRTVKVTATPALIDNTPPVITLKGLAKLTIELGAAYKDAGATAFDTKDGVLTPVKTGLVHTAVVGIYTLKYNKVDKAGNKAAQVIRTVSVVDTTRPVVTAPASGTLEATAVKTVVTLGTAKATDAGTPVLTATAAPVGPYTVGVHTITWSATDKAGNVGIATQRVTVRDTTAPVFTGLPLTSVTAQATAVATAVKLTAPTATDIFAVTVISNAPATFPVGTTKVTWTATDANGVTSTAIQNVVVQDTTPPVFKGTPLTAIKAQATGAATKVKLTAPTATDIFAVTVTSNAPSTFPVGTTKVTWTATDANGVVSTTVQNIVVQDVTAPVIALNGVSPISINQNATFTDPGSVVTDNVSTGLTATVTGAVNTAVIGSYILTYNAKDTAGNPAIAVIRTVKVTAVVAAARTLASYFTGGNAASNLNTNNGYEISTSSWSGVNGSAIIDKQVFWDVATGTFKALVSTAGNSSYRLAANGTWILINGTSSKIVDKGAAGLQATDVDGFVTIHSLSSTTPLAGLNITQTLKTKYRDNNGTRWASVINPKAVFSANATMISGASKTQQASYSIGSYTFKGCTPLGKTKNCNSAQYYDQITNKQVYPTKLSQLLSIIGSKLPHGSKTVQLYKDLYFISGAVGDKYQISLMATASTSTTGKARIYHTPSGSNMSGAYNWNVQTKSGDPTLNPTVAITIWNRVTVNGQTAIEIVIPSTLKVTAWASSLSKLGFAVQDSFVRQVNVTAKGRASPWDMFDQTAIADVKANFGYDKTPPVIQLNGSSTMTVAINTIFNDPGVRITDNLSTGLKATVTGAVKTAVAGAYTLTYKATDTAGNVATVTRVVNVMANTGGGNAGGGNIADKTSPVITLNGSSLVLISQNSVFTDPGAVVTDNVSTGLTATVTGTVNTAVIGSYILTYNAKDAAGNAATAVTRTVSIIAALPAAKIGTLASYFTGGNSLSHLNLDPGNMRYDYNIMSWNGAPNTAMTNGNVVWDPATSTFTTVPARTFIEYRLSAQGWLAVDTNKSTLVDHGATGIFSTHSNGSVTQHMLSSVTNISGQNIKSILATQFPNSGGSYSAWSSFINPTAVFAANAKQVSGIDSENQDVYRIPSYTPQTNKGCTPYGLTKNCNVARFYDQATKQSVIPTLLSQLLSMNGAKATGIGDGTLPLYNDLYFLGSHNGGQYSVSLMANTTTDTTGSARIYAGTGVSGAYDWSKVNSATRNPALNTPVAITTWNRVVVNGKTVIEIVIPATVVKPSRMGNISKLAFTVQDGFVRPVEFIKAGAINAFSLLNQVALANVKAAMNAKFDSVAPTLVVFASATIKIPLNSQFVAPSSFVRDNTGNRGLVATITGSVNTAVPGSYKLIYTAKDAAGNAAIPVTITVNVI